jgi:hypothetical protein
MGKLMHLDGTNKVLLLVFLTAFLSTIVIKGLAYSSTVVNVFPHQNCVKVGQTFSITINVENVSGLQGFDFSLKYPSTILNVSKVEEGPFLASFGPTFVAKLEVLDDYESGLGRVWMAAVICGDGFADGSGTLATITFIATGEGEGKLDLFSDPPYKSNEIKLVTCGPQPIPHTVEDGYVVVSADPNDPPDDPPRSLNPDLNGDGRVNIRDVAIVAKAFGKSKGDPKYNPLADLDQNGIVNIEDITIVAAEYGRVL